MSRLLGFAFVLGSAGTLFAQVIIDPLHGYCGGTGQCLDNGDNSPTTNNPPTNFGFTISPAKGVSADLLIEILVPDNEDPTPSTLSFTITGGATTPATASLYTSSTFSGTSTSTDWKSGGLDAFLGLSASPNSPIGGYLPCTQNPSSCKDAGTGDPGANGYYVYQADVGTETLGGTPNVAPLLTLGSTIPVGSYISGFFGGDVAPASSGAIFEDCSGSGCAPTPSVPEPTSVALLGTVLLMVGSFMRRKLS